MPAGVQAAPRRPLVQTLLLTLVAAASSVAHAVAPVLTQEDWRYSWIEDTPGRFQFGWKLPENTTVTKHQYRYTVWNRELIPSSWTQDWTDISLEDTRCQTIHNPGTPSASSTTPVGGAACASTGTSAALQYDYWTAVEGFAAGQRYRLELRAVNNDGNSDAVIEDFAMPANPDAIVTIADAQLETHVRRRINSIRTLSADAPITQLHMARIPTIFVHQGPRTPETRIRSLSGLEYAINMEHIIALEHSMLAIPEVERMYQMRIFNYHGSLLSDLSPLRNLINLERLYLNRGLTYPPEGVCTGTADGPEHGNPVVWPPSASCPEGQVDDDVVVRDIRPLRRLTKLHTLWLCDQRANPDHLTTLVNMEYMSFCRNDVSDISGMSGMTKMKDIYLFENRIEDVSPLAGMTELRALQLHDNGIRDISSLSGLTKLRHIELSDNPLDAGVCADSVGTPLGQHTTRTACEDASGNWTTNVVSTLAPLVTGQCSDDSYATEAACQGAGGTWTAGTLKLIDLRGDTTLTDADVSALSSLTGVTVLHDADIRPSVPQGLSFSTSTRAATLTWTDPSDADIAAYQYRHRQAVPPPARRRRVQYRHRQGDGAWSDWTLSTKEGSSFHSWARGPADLTSLELSDLAGGEHEVELRALVASGYNTARTTNSDGTPFSGLKTHSTAVAAANVGAGRWEIGRVLTPGPATSTMVGVPVTASIASTVPEALTETNLDGATVTVELSGTTFGASLAATSFPLTTSPAIAGLTVASVSRTSDTEAALTLRFDSTDFTLQSTLSVQVLAAALASASDLDTETVAVTPTLGLMLSQAMLALDETAGSNTGSYTAELSGQPAGAVTVTPSSSNSDVTTSGALSFSTTNWDTAQTVTVTAGQDFDAVDDVAHVTHAVTGIPGLASGPRVRVTVSDDDTRGLTVPTSLSVTEGGALSTYTVVLDAQPTGPVTVALSSSDRAVSLDADINTAGNQDSLLFSTTNWNVAQTVYVTGAQDDDGEGESVTLTHDPSGADYGDVANAEVTVSVTDNDTPGATRAPINLTVQENGTASYTLALDTEPAGGDVSVAVASSDSSTIAVSPAALTFTAGNWNVPQRVTVEGLDDADATDESGTVGHVPTGADYGTATIGDVTVTVLDDDAAGVEVSPVDLTVGESSTATYAVRLNAAPSATTTVTMATSTGIGVTLDTDPDAPGNQNTLSFTATDWNTARTVTVAGVADDDGEDETGTVTHTLTGDAVYAALNANRIPSVSVRVEDDRTAGVVVEPSSLTFDEGGEARYEVKLSAPPASGSATVSVTPEGTAELSVTVAGSLTFDATNWDTAKSVLVLSTADHARVSDATATLSHGVAGYGTVDSGPDVSVRVRNTTVDYDSDADGLIEVWNLAQLNEVRWDLDGDGTGATSSHAAAFPNARNGAVCPTATTGVACAGYELMRDLDFASDRTYANWLPIGVSSADNQVSAYTGTFSGNGRVIANMRVGDISVGASLQPPTAAGLFGRAEGRIESLGLVNARVRGGSDVGTIAGDLRGHLVASYATGEVTGQDNCGGLAGSTRGSARDAARIVASYANVSVRCNGAASGLGAARAGGLVGLHTNGPIVASYAVGRVRSARGGAGGLAGRGPKDLWVGTVDDSYWDREATGQGTSYTSSQADVTTGNLGTSVATPTGGLTTAAMQSPTRYSGVYADWNVDLDGDYVADDPWDFGTSSQYPSLKWRGFDLPKQIATQPRPPSVTEPGDGSDANQAPEIARALADATLEEDGTLTVDLGAAFWDPDADQLTYSARSSNSGVASVSVYEDALVVSAGSFGVATVTVTASDGNLSASQTFAVRVGLLVEFAGDASAPEGGTIRLRLVASEPAPRRLEVAYAVAPGSDPSTAADASDHAGGTGGEVVFAAGAEGAEIRIDVLDDDAVEPVREHFALTLLPPAEGAGYGVGERAGAVATIEEGVCDRGEAVRDALRGGVSCEAVADLSTRTSLRLSELGLVRLSAADLLGLTRLRLLDVSRNGLSAWPEGVLAALPSLRALRLGGNRIDSLPESLGAHGNLLELVLSNNALAALPAGAFQGLSELRQLLLDGNALEELPAGLFEGVGQLRELHLQDNPGAPFMLTMELARTDGQTWAPGPASVAARVAQGAPFALEAALEASAGKLPEGAAVSVPAGAAQGAPATVQQSGAVPATVRLTAAPAVPAIECEHGLLQRRCFQGLAIRAGEPLVLFKQPPMPLAVDDQTLEAGGDALRFDLSERFEAAAGEALKYKAESSDESVLRVRVVDGVLIVEALDEGEATVTVVATDEDGQTGTLRFLAQATELLHGGWRGWRVILLEQARATER